MNITPTPLASAPDAGCRGWKLVAIALLAGLQACMFLPRVTQVYDHECRTFGNHLVLEQVQVAAIQQCANQGCLALVIGATAVTAASVIVSGTIVIVGNVAYWLERQAGCPVVR